MACTSVTVEPVLFLFMMSLFMMLTTNQLLFIKKVCASHFDETICSNLSAFKDEEDVVQTEASHWILFFSICTNVPGAFMSMFLGATSDRVGRKYIMCLPPLGTAFSASVFALSSYFIASPLGYIIVAAIAVGLTGSVGTAYVTLISYMADITDQSSRTKRFGILEAMMFIGGTVGLLCAGAIGSFEHGFTTVYLLVLTIQILIIVYILCCLDESLKPEHRLPSNEKDKPLGAGCLPRRCLCWGPILDSMRRSFTVFFAKRPGNKRKYLISVQVIGLLGVIGLSGEMDLLVLFTKHSPLSWDVSTIGIFMALKNTMKGVVLIALLPLMFRCIGKERVIHRDLVLAQVGLVSTILSLVNEAFSRQTAIMMLVPMVGCLSGITGAVISSFKTQLVEPNEFGGMFACTSFLDTCFQVAGSLLFNTLYPATLHIWPGFSFLIMAAVYVISLLIVIWLQWDMKKSIKEGKNGLGQRRLLDEDESEDEFEDTVYMTQLPVSVQPDSIGV
ncbi:proton-coupled folate transporter-like [Patiria miniata]|uniref:Major facilitator superfamily (MFS) profile domain-containing protein n=1 Tax=Patiria miniata TaxID=46514 RepID=A0A914BFY2_PATMI|nr:proton-coupled folate transporter-like [Patiria miniata]XP_038074999.1 proton-coupled folate transporter-like [Patiria miniata]XP_038075007.1 proton-coupled folate transporter-like [Patiria miniata]